MRTRVCLFFSGLGESEVEVEGVAVVRSVRLMVARQSPLVLIPSLPLPLYSLFSTSHHHQITHIDPLRLRCGGGRGLQRRLVEPERLVDGIAERLGPDRSVGDVAERRAPARRELRSSTRRGVGHGCFGESRGSYDKRGTSRDAQEAKRTRKRKRKK